MKLNKKRNPKNNGEIDSNKFNNLSEQQKLREKAINSLEVAKQIEFSKIARGYIFIHKEKSSKLVHPDKVQENLLNGWKL